MASTSDIRDIMNLGQAGPRQPAPKKKKHVEPQPRVTGFKREVQALMGDSVPPIALVEQRSYKSRPSISQKLFKARHWEERPFQHGARTDGLVLRHWKRSIPGSQVRPPALTNVESSADVEMTDHSKAAPEMQEIRFEEEFPSHKWDVKVQTPLYTDEQYETLLKSDDWTKQETDYLMGLCREYDLRWVIIADRYDTGETPISPTQQNGEVAGNEVALRSSYPPRSMEALKQRYYAIAAKILETQIPASNMTQTEFQLWEKMRNFDAKTETMRKAMAEKLFERTKDEADEERTLLEELHRITKNEDDFIKMRAELYARLEPVAPIRRNERGEEQPTAMYQTSSGLSMLLQTLLAKEKRLKPRPAVGTAESGAASATPTDAQKHEKGRHPNQYSRRDTMDTQAEEAGPQKKGSTSVPNVRILTPPEETRFGVSHPQERLTSGVQFRHEKINRLTMAKSQTQTTKIQAALTELGIPPRLLMPTERVCREFERLVREINVLLDARKVNEKVATEIKILEEAKRIRLGLPKEEEQADQAPGDVTEYNSSQFIDSKLETVDDSSMAVPDEDKDADGEDDEPADDTNLTNGRDESTMVVDKDEDDADADEDADDGGQPSARRQDADEDDEDDEQQEQAEEEDEDEDQNDNLDLSITRLEQENDDDEEEEEADEEEDDDQPRLGVDEDEDAEERDEEDDEEEVSPEVSDAEEDADNDDQDEQENAQADDEEAEPEVEESEEEQEADADEHESAVAADEDGAEDGNDEEVVAPASAATRLHKRSASVISEASRAGSNRSGLGRKKRR
ncbi:swr complex subunit [Elasticomyces elasticus]|uniref:SWR1-complex protein 4 n=1 Tax=Exophiala sideris TaxID=1016849 RepID=A0ABR0JDD6_9EURO|nr:swr complex subunit [Elasticomyces elasticus]KAK5031910.1 swr complex subunit [Exophiala sideris]KAK5040839.1 swr complex subunit [Exophiala sideris]KAK5061826.1 swr complex subunit [Exophiala sideris]KAK5184526.1 swr complex subunit [Eurotiomycetes sp. CCFEE 6388]